MRYNHLSEYQSFTHIKCTISVMMANYNNHVNVIDDGE